ncbi:MAG: hypothetical protein PHG84_04555 [Endomicrobiaceae bacterium]|nr:hypothetical protein [Endomicrobiaceae bacterium]
MQKAKIVNNKILNKQLSDIDRIYIGNDYCENNLDYSKINQLIDFYNNKVKISLLLPFLTDKSFDRVSNILKTLENINSKYSEIIFNDWGTFYYLRTYYPKLNLVMGRLLTKQKKDPRADIILKNKQDKVKVIKSNDCNKIIHTKKVPGTLVDIFARHSVESDEIFDFLLKNNVSRIEIDNLVWNMVSLLPKDIKVSLYFPYILLTVTRYCGGMNGKYSKVCNFDCRNKATLLEDGFYINGNAVYYKNDILPSNKVFKSNNIDRIVYQNNI